MTYSRLTLWSLQLPKALRAQRPAARSMTAAAQSLETQRSSWSLRSLQRPLATHLPSRLKARALSASLTTPLTIPLSPRVVLAWLATTLHPQPTAFWGRRERPSLTAISSSSLRLKRAQRESRASLAPNRESVLPLPWFPVLSLPAARLRRCQPSPWSQKRSRLQWKQRRIAPASPSPPLLLCPQRCDQRGRTKTTCTSRPMKAKTQGNLLPRSSLALIKKKVSQQNLDFLFFPGFCVFLGNTCHH